MTNIIIVDKNDNSIAIKRRGTILENDIYRVSALWLTNKNDEVLIAQRSFNKSNAPGKWGPAVEGTVEEGESYISNVIKEAKEEIGLYIAECDLVEGSKFFIEIPYKTRFHQFFTLQTDIKINDLQLQIEEVEQVKYKNINELKKDAMNDPCKYVTSVSKYLNLKNL